MTASTTTLQVTFVSESAGYENTFGWYNVNAPAQLYPITPCADEPGSPARTVDFQAEYTAGHYLGGFIGFFLITPENQPVGTNCGTQADGSPKFCPECGTPYGG